MRGTEINYRSVESPAFLTVFCVAETMLSLTPFVAPRGDHVKCDRCWTDAFLRTRVRNRFSDIARTAVASAAVANSMTTTTFPRSRAREQRSQAERGRKGHHVHHVIC